MRPSGFPCSQRPAFNDRLSHGANRRRNALDPAGAVVRGYAYHYARSQLANDPPAYRFADGSTDGVARATLLSAFVHRHFLVGDEAIARFVAACSAVIFRAGS